MFFIWLAVKSWGNLHQQPNPIKIKIVGVAIPERLLEIGHIIKNWKSACSACRTWHIWNNEIK